MPRDDTASATSATASARRCRPSLSHWETCEQQQPFGQQGVADQNRGCLVVGDVDGGAPAAQHVVVHSRQVVVNQRVGVDELQPTGRFGDGFGVSTGRAVSDAGEYRADPLAAGKDRVGDRPVEAPGPGVGSRNEHARRPASTTARSAASNSSAFTPGPRPRLPATASGSSPSRSWLTRSSTSSSRARHFFARSIPFSKSPSASSSPTDSSSSRATTLLELCQLVFETYASSFFFSLMDRSVRRVSGPAALGRRTVTAVPSGLSV